ncbi:unnamed protein product [Allacma fusca]|uniref:Protein phosphatase 1 regulatory subunit 12A n=1 Tax=Allacma fusca TaxID=39272 RepID=A0A8J2LK58_9HEXA|nr:unnamed protein product [Allacma fusca]
MTLGGGSHAESAMAAFSRRQGQLESWRDSDTAKESSDIRNRPKRVKFADKCIFQAACASNDKAQVARMVRDGYDINAVDEDGITALHQACIDDNFEMVEFLLDNGADVNISDNEGWTPLHAVASCCYASITKLLLENGADVVALNNDCCIPLDICKNEEIKELFKQEINGRGIDLHEARRREEIKMIEDSKKWINSGDYQETPHPLTGATGLHVAACKGYIKVIDLLLKAGANINSQDFDGWTPLHAAAHWGQKEACEVLLENMCDMNVKNNCDQTAFDVADDSIVPILEDFKKKHDVNKNIDSVGKQTNVLPLPPKKKPPKAVFDEGLTIVTSQPGRIPEISNSASEEEANEAEDTVGELPSSDPADFLTLNTLHSDDKDEICNVVVPKDSDVPTRIGDLRDSPKLVKSAEKETDISVVPGSASPSSSAAAVSGNSGMPNVVPLAHKPHVDSPVEDNTPSWRRGGSLRTRTNASQYVEDKANDRTVRRTRSETSQGSDVNLRRAYSFESDSTFYTRLTSARNRIKAIEAASAAMTANLLDPTSLNSNHDLPLISSSLTNQNNPPHTFNSLEVVLRRKDTDSPRSPRPSTISTSTPQQRPSSAASNNNTVQLRRSFVPPARDEESETQRKAHAKRVRETRRSTQGVTLEELKSAEQYVKNSQQQANATLSGPAPFESNPPYSATVPANISTVLRKEEEQSLERRPSWRLRVDDTDRNKFSLEDTRNPAPRSTTSGSASASSGLTPDNMVLVPRSPSARRSNKTESAPAGKPPRPPQEERDGHALDEEKEKEMKNSGAQGAILRKKKQKRRSTGVVQYNTDGADPDRQDSSLSDAETGSGRGSGLSNDVDQTGADSSRSENGVSRINYKKLYEEILKENILLKTRISRFEEEVSDLKIKLEKVQSQTPRITCDESEKREKRALELKMEAMELELREVRHLKSENQKIRDENGALIRVIKIKQLRIFHVYKRFMFEKKKKSLMKEDGRVVDKTLRAS